MDQNNEKVVILSSGFIIVEHSNDAMYNGILNYFLFNAHENHLRFKIRKL